jgi:MerR family copper efflux transcriptional regulator
MNIGQVAEKVGLNAKIIRYYEEIGLIYPDRGPNGYREFGEPDLHKPAFVRQARQLGFSIDECRALLNLCEDHQRSSSDVKLLAARQLAEIDVKIAELQKVRLVLADFVEQCSGDERPNCLILDKLSGRKVLAP